MNTHIQVGHRVSWWTGDCRRRHGQIVATPPGSLVVYVREDRTGVNKVVTLRSVTHEVT